MIYDGNYIELQDNDLLGERYWFSDGDKENFMFYNKDIFIKNILGFSCLLPIAFKIRAVINYKTHGITLDVSRNNIISNKKIIQNEIEKIILKYIQEQELTVERKEIVSAMINVLSD